ncbi:TauD/TfdA family dioxygenase [Amycolatopsis sp. NPDC059235]|uniref:TauD/TfdA family dioxygenase n=1 Tax=Amycolatopsis sp. NPDC059235 TaxID=3346782 RepID=UPI00366E1662
MLGRRFHHVWLRDNCLCGDCREAGSFQKTVDLGQISGAGAVRRVEVSDEVLYLEWDEVPEHSSTFPIEWLLAHAYDPPGEEDGESVELWDAKDWELSPPRWHRLDDADPGGGEWADDLARYGFVLLDGVSEASLDKFAARIGPIFETEFGHVTVVQSSPDATDLALSGAELSVHTDFSPHMHTPPLLQFMLCVEHDATGGDSILVDGFKAAEDLRRESPDKFGRLVRIPINFQQFYADREFFHQRQRPILEVDPSGSVSGVFFAHSHAANWRLPPDEVTEYYDAYHAFFDYLKDPARQFRLRLGAGQCIALQNGRLLHGRTAYDPRSGGRTLITEFVAWEYFSARRRFHRQRRWYADPREAGQHVRG